jgi:hypothetical protein
MVANMAPAPPVAPTRVRKPRLLTLVGFAEVAKEHLQDLVVREVWERSISGDAAICKRRVADRLLR